ncbi:hypothetical protein, partial [Methylosinus sp. R-45379]|uniref:hypothetical protein n=1 Tax=Methylosinus sp. R-45379 TaxID=980563 RepID=UPI000AF6D6F9
PYETILGCIQEQAMVARSVCFDDASIRRLPAWFAGVSTLVRLTWLNSAPPEVRVSPTEKDNSRHAPN